jgi:hypothetical protein
MVTSGGKKENNPVENIYILIIVQYGKSLESRVASKARNRNTLDTVGCGYNWEKENVFFTHNGTLIQGLIPIKRGKFFPKVEFSNSARITANFGGSPFLYQPHPQQKALE